VVMDGSGFDYSRREPPQTAMRYLRISASKIVKLRSLWRFLTLRSDYAWLWKNARSVLLRAKDKLVKKLSFSQKSSHPDASTAGSRKPPIGLSSVFVTAARQAMKRSNVLFIYGDNDGFLWDFTDLYAAAHLSESQRDRVLRVVAHANHMFIWPEWQQQAFELIDNWISSEVLPTIPTA
jgi:pimeloyl-ACP methyl ester carboxylesterase